MRWGSTWAVARLKDASICKVLERGGAGGDWAVTAAAGAVAAGLLGCPSDALRWLGEAVGAGLPPRPFPPLAPHSLSVVPKSRGSQVQGATLPSGSEHSKGDSLMRGFWEV